MADGKKRNWILILLVLAALYLFSGFLANITAMTGPVAESGNVAVIPIQGVITGDSNSFETVASSRITDRVEQAAEDDDIEAIILEINSPGGSAVASEEIANAVADVNKTSVGWIREIGTSGAYWAASATDHIIASPVSTTGSIGVIGSYLGYDDFIERFNITYRRLVSGKYKDLGSPFKNLTDDEKEKLQGKLDLVHEHFIDQVSANREMPREDVSELATGMIYMGEEAAQNGLVDELGGEDAVHDYIEDRHNITVTTVRYEREPSFMQYLQQLSSSLGTAIGEGLTQTKGTSSSDLKPYTSK